MKNKDHKDPYFLIEVLSKEFDLIEISQLNSVYI